MKNSYWKLHYIDLFAGAGIERLQDRRLEWGSPLIAAQAPRRFAQLHLCDNHVDAYGAMVSRLRQFPQPTMPHVVCGDANDCVHAIVAQIPTRGSLSLAFLDPYGLHLHFDTIRALAARKTDLIIFFPDHLDALRNWEVVYRDNPNSNLDLVLGTSSWRAIFEDEPKQRWAEALRDLYVEQIRTLGYDYWDFERIARTDGRKLYLLIFCSRHKTGGRFWRRIARRKPSGEDTFVWNDD